VLALAGPARADRIDARLHEHAPKMTQALRQHGVQNVGVLRFRAERGKRPEGFNLGPINDGLAARVENLLVIHADRSEPIGVIRDAGREAAARKVGAWFTSPAERKKLFAHTYPLAWGKTSVKPDGFLTGEVRCTGDMLRTTVVVELFTASNPNKLIPVAEFTVPTDRLTLVDLGLRFNVAKRSKGLARSADVDRFAIGEARRRDASDLPIEPDPGTGGGGSNNSGNSNNSSGGSDNTGGGGDSTLDGSIPDIGGVSFRVTAGDAQCPIQPSPGGSTPWQVVSPEAGKAVAFVMKNNSSEARGVVLKVNEVSTIFEQQEDSSLCRKWVIKPGATVTVRGFYLEGKQFAPFKVLVGDEAKAMAEQLGDKAGKIRVEVFAGQGGGDEDEDADVSLPRRLPATRSVAASRSLETLQKTLMRSARVTRVADPKPAKGNGVKRELIVPDKEALQPSPDLKEVDFKAADQPIAAELIQIVKP
jgi:hypothetical protein